MLKMKIKNLHSLKELQIFLLYTVKIEVQQIIPLLTPFRYAQSREQGSLDKWQSKSQSAIQKKKKGDRRLPRIKYFCIAYVQSFNP